ncbi:hypothetical protein [Pseudoduganella albidiflava]|uniref:DUF3325 family protein n=1 Tax=Pseudoduganella albidiflava TaxID=321983 RepID=A0A411WWL3_9BURK|nr:hypothetical protein [Pseudoduganella albidiflava]QBI01183.1 hypothetical protein EYF70_10255 [Pseudoduganella albidiflava]GGY48753.1 hypothetical protein GCM10007387_33750 [Pseudoduganella albidiflava]
MPGNPQNALRRYSRATFVSLAIFGSTLLLARLAWTGALSDEASRCGQFGMHCFVNAVATVLIGSVAGSIAALAALISTSWRGWLNWLALLLNAGLLLALLVWFFGP